MIDTDGFKEVNDTYSHDAGDIVLQRLARELQHSVYSDDIVCRSGGDEFIVICPNTSPIPSLVSPYFLTFLLVRYMLLAGVFLYIAIAKLIVRLSMRWRYF